MTNSMIPFSFIPGTKAKASEVNANFIAIAELINANKNTSTINFEKVYENLAKKADKTELINEFEISDSGTDLNNYKTKGMYIFSTLYTPTNSPNGEAGTLFVNGVENSNLKQFWLCKETNEIYQREFFDEKWSEWTSLCGNFLKNNPGYLILPNGLIIQWGAHLGGSATYPIAFNTEACVIFSKVGYGAGNERSDTGVTEEKLTGFTVGSAAQIIGIRYVAFGYYRRQNMKYYGTKNNKDYGFYLEKFENSIEITDKYWEELLNAQNSGKIIINYNNSVIAVNEFEYSNENGSWKKLSNEEYQAKQLAHKNNLRLQKIQEELVQLDKKRIRALAEPSLKDENTTWLEYYNSQIKILREELNSL